ncbi:MAG: glycosyltransferase [Candidatus Omnitrophota bacterium]
MITKPRTKNQELRTNVNIFILIDALGWEYIKDRPFLDKIAKTKMPVKSILGFSSGVIPSILTGKSPKEHKHWSLYYYSPKTSPFRWSKAFLWLPKKVLNSRISRKIVEEISKRLMGYTGYFETYLISVEKLHLFDICERKNIYKPRGIKSAKSIFDVLQKNRIDYKCFTYPLKDNEIIAKTKQALDKSKNSVYFLYLSESDALLHRACKNKEKINAMISYYEKEIQEVYDIAAERFSDVNLFVFSDHGMAVIDKSFDLKKDIDGLGFKMPEDYIAFYDSTMSRFWFSNDTARTKITDELKNKNYGRILSADEIKTLGLDFEDNMYGELIFLMNTGSVINPSFMGNKIPQGMHGFDISDKTMNACLISNREIKEEIKDVRDFFQLMLQVTGHRSQVKKKIRILYFLNSKVRAGVEEHVLSLLQHLDKNKFEPILVSPQELINLMPEIESLNIRYYPINIRRWRNIGEILKLWRILKKEMPDIVHSHLFFATMFAAPLAKLAGIPYVIETAHLREAWRKGIKKAYFIDRIFYRFVDKVIAVSYAIKNYLVNDKKLPQEKIGVIHNGIDTEKFKPGLTIKNNDEFRVGVIGRLEEQKGHKYLLEAVNLLNGKFDNVKFLIVGDGSLKKKLVDSVECLGISNKVEFLGYRHDIKEIIAGLDLIVLPSLYEGLPLIALEAGAMAKPIIVTNVDGSPEAVLHNKTGLIIPPKNSSALKEAMERLLENKNLIGEFGKNAQEFIRKEFDIRKQVSRTEKLYGEIRLRLDYPDKPGNDKILI